MANATFGDIKQLNAAGSQLGATNAIIYTPTSGYQGQICTFLLHNVSSSSQTVYLYNNGTASANRIYSFTVLPGDSPEESLKVPLVLQNGQSLYGYASAASAVNIVLLGSEGQ